MKKDIDWAVTIACLLSGIVVGGVLLLLGAPGWAASGFGVVVYLVIGKGS
jgi:hypothetical protein